MDSIERTCHAKDALRAACKRQEGGRKTGAFGEIRKSF